MKQTDLMKQEVQDVLQTNILPFWLDKMIDRENRGFYGRIDGHGVLHPDAEKGAILNARILWTFSAAYRVLKRPEYLAAATRAKDYILEHFYDKEFGGIYWSLDCLGRPKDTKKQFYAIGFAIYGLSEYARATADREALDYAIRLFECIEQHSLDRKDNGYIEACTREWGKIEDMRLSDFDANYPKSQNTHLHIIEPYTNLFRIWKDERLEKALRNLINIFTDKILNPETHHLDLFFDNDWTRGAGHLESYGHDIECSWLMHEAALVLGDEEVLRKVEPIVKLVAKASEKGLNADGSMVHEANVDTGHVDDDLHWWVQAEAVVGFFNIYQYFGDEQALEKATHCWQYIKQNLIDNENGEWYWSRHADGTLNLEDDKAGFWKCPYHNGRMCLELIERI
ncbi:AGE family epimerase/isomerase [Prevotella sp. P2-180]|uniref:AGE family epimerase/isomerase n=1 Tax=Prevotella sp. P2-180 TaxID=2024224 RepID=UPI00155748DD|nr:AGE family epimerase/isomerase [Prevotella sp. P2-180]MCI6336697.1 AGE family epimerase/isomerase [Prevotella sp.]MCI7089055.1 AGE family epimerase/isomerase [Prevotella sp.]MDD5783651.1 AGE family epimerase/isomerase [Prevotella sp.]MDD6863781.1 AGE family epimerase/isomerase [Prevotella sp.]